MEVREWGRWKERGLLGEKKAVTASYYIPSDEEDLRGGVGDGGSGKGILHQVGKKPGTPLVEDSHQEGNWAHSYTTR